MVWVFYSLGFFRCWSLYWRNKVFIYWFWRFSVLIVFVSLFDWGGEGRVKNRLFGSFYNKRILSRRGKGSRIMGFLYSFIFLRRSGWE